MLVCTEHDIIQSKLSTKVSHGELQKWPLLTGGLCSERQKLLFHFHEKIKTGFCIQETTTRRCHYAHV